MSKLTAEQREEIVTELHILLGDVIRAMVAGVEQGVEQWRNERKDEPPRMVTMPLNEAKSVQAMLRTIGWNAALDSAIVKAEQ